jgi:hypothetical protein
VTHVSDQIEIHEPDEEKPDEPKAVARPRSNAGALVHGDDMADLLRLAVERGTPVEQLTALVDLRERMEARQARREYFAALKAFQEEYATNPVIKSRKADIVANRGADYAYKYANADDIVRHIGPMLMNHGLTHKWGAKTEGQMLTCTTIIMHVGGHAEASDFTVPTENKAGMSPQQKVGSAMSYAQARGLANALGITITDEQPEVVDPTPVSEEQLEDIQKACADYDVPVDRLLKLAGVKKASDIRRGDYLKVLAAIDEYAEYMKKRAAKKGGTT